jgi:hypothetical protein
MFKKGSHDPFKYLKHKLWPQKGLEIKLSIWLSTTKNQESPWLPCMQIACHIPLKICRWGIELWCKPHLNRMSEHKIMNLQSHGRPTWESRDKMTFGWHLGVGPVAMHKVHYKGEGGGFPQVRAVVSLVSSCLPVACQCTKSVPTLH